jgi:hypothetical protein
MTYKSDTLKNMGNFLYENKQGCEYIKKKWEDRNKILFSWAPVAHTYNPSYSGGRDQENRSSRPTLGKQFERPYLKKHPSQKRAGGVAQGVGPGLKPQYCKRKIFLFKF